MPCSFFLKMFLDHVVDGKIKKFVFSKTTKIQTFLQEKNFFYKFTIILKIKVSHFIQF